LQDQPAGAGFDLTFSACFRGAYAGASSVDSTPADSQSAAFHARSMSGTNFSPIPLQQELGAVLDYVGAIVADTSQVAPGGRSIANTSWA
jgi:hypothetical protein